MCTRQREEKVYQLFSSQSYFSGWSRRRKENVDESDPYRSTMAPKGTKYKALAVTNRWTQCCPAIRMYPPPSQTSVRFLIRFSIWNVECHAAHFSWISPLARGTCIFYRCLVEILCQQEQQLLFIVFVLHVHRPRIEWERKSGGSQWQNKRRRKKKKKLSGKHPVVF